MKRRLYFLILLATALSSCIKEPANENRKEIVLEARIQDEDTKTSLSQSYNGFHQILWNNGDEIAVFGDIQQEPEKFTIVSGMGTTSATFTGATNQDIKSAIYPHDVAISHSDNTYELLLPARQKYSVTGTDSFVYPMFAEKSNSVLLFKNLCSILNIQMTGVATVRSIKVKAVDPSVKLSGRARLEVEGTDVRITMDENASNEVSLECDMIELNRENATSFYIVVPAQTYPGGFEVEVDGIVDTMFIRLEGDIMMKRSELRSVSLIECTIPENMSLSSMPDNQIWYQTQDNKALTINPEVQFSSSVVSHTYNNSKGIITFDTPLTFIRKELFSSSHGMVTSLLLPSTVSIIGINALREMSFEEFTFPTNLKYIGISAFASCERLKEVILPEGVIGTDADAFSNCTSISRVVLPKTLIEIDAYVFHGCNRIPKFEGECPFVSDDGLFLYQTSSYSSISTEKTVLCKAANAGLSSLYIPEGTTGMQNYAIEGMEELREIHLPEGFVNLSPYSIVNCPNLSAIYGRYSVMNNRAWMPFGTLLYYIYQGEKEIHFPEGVNYIGTAVLAELDNVETLDVPEGVTALEDYAICENPKLKSLTIPSTMQDVSYGNFGACPMLNDIYMKPLDPPTITTSDDMAYGHSGLKIHVPRESLDKYLESEQWKKYRSYFVGFDF